MWLAEQRPRLAALRETVDPALREVHIMLPGAEFLG